MLKNPLNNNLVKAQESTILVAIRIRPLNLKEINNGQINIVKYQDNLIVIYTHKIILDPIELQFESENKKMLEVYHRSKQQRYTFDKVYREHKTQQIYKEICRPLLRYVLNGQNSTVFAYGPTGTGKTYTMLGNQEIYGVSVLTIKDLFQFVKNDKEFEYDIVITYVQIYNQMIRDLLVPSSSYLELRDDPEKGMVISGVNQFKAQSTQQVLNLLLSGNRRRTTQATNVNLTSSRSHAVFQVTINKRSRIKNTNVQTLVGKLSLIDLAGSQRGTVTQNRGIRLVQGAKINRSLLALANCINALGEKSKKGFFVPYRDSKLTRLLKDSLGGNCKTVMIANVSPASSQFEQTLNTLKYANRAKNIKTKVITNKKLVHLHISQYKNIITDLRSEIQQLKVERIKQLKLHDKSSNTLSYQPEFSIEESKAKQTCQCGRGFDNQQMNKIQEQIFDNFQERIQLRRALMQIEQQNAFNILEIKRKQAQIVVWKKIQEIDKKINEQLKEHQKAIATLKSSTQKNILKKEYMNVQLMENITNAKKIRDEIPKRIRFKDKRDFLQIVIKNHILELQNIELQINLQIQQKSIIDLKAIIENQRKVIMENNIEGIKFRDQDQLNFLNDQIVFQMEELIQVPASQEENEDQQYFFQEDQFSKAKLFEKPIKVRDKSAKQKLNSKKSLEKLIQQELSEDDKTQKVILINRKKGTNTLKIRALILHQKGQILIIRKIFPQKSKKNERVYFKPLFLKNFRQLFKLISQTNILNTYIIIRCLPKQTFIPFQLYHSYYFFQFSNSLYPFS